MSELARHICMAANLGMRDDAEQAIDSIVAERDALTREVEQLRGTLETEQRVHRATGGVIDALRAENNGLHIELLATTQLLRHAERQRDEAETGQAALLARCDVLDAMKTSESFNVGFIDTDDVRALLGAADPTPTAPRWAEPDSGPDDGHTWRIEITSRSSSSVTGDPGHHDAGEFTGPLRTAVRGWSLSAALSAAADLPLFCWLGFDDDAATTPSASPSDSESEVRRPNAPAHEGCRFCGEPDVDMGGVAEMWCCDELMEAHCSCGRALPCRHCTQETT